MEFLRLMAVAAAVTVVLALGSGLPSAAASERLDFPKDFFPIFPWDGHMLSGDVGTDPEGGLKSIAECNFTAAFVGAENLPECEKLGLKAIIRPPKRESPWVDKWVNVSDDVVDASTRKWIESVGKSPVVIGYYLTDEPGTPKFHALGTAVAAVEKYAPGKLGYINLFPGYATIGAPDQSQLGANSFTEYLERFVSDVKPQMLSYDDYMIFTSDNMQHEGKAAVYFQDLMEVRRVSQEHGLPFWNTVCSNQIRPWTTVPSPANLLLQAYTTLAAGGRGLAWYTYHQGGYHYAPVDNSGRRTDTWEYLRMANRQVKVLGPIMNRLKSTGVFFTDPAPAKGLPLLPGRVVKSVDSRSSLRIDPPKTPKLMIGEFEGDDGCDYVMVVNLSLEHSANIKLHLRKDGLKTEVFSARNGSTSPFDEENGHWLVPGAGVLVRVRVLGS